MLKVLRQMNACEKSGQQQRILDLYAWLYSTSPVPDSGRMRSLPVYALCSRDPPKLRVSALPGVCAEQSSLTE